MQKILLIDRVLDRKAAWATQIVATALKLDVWSIGDDDQARSGNAWSVSRNSNEKCPTPDIVIVHYRDEAKKPVALAFPEMTFWYGALGEEKDKKKDWKVCRKLGNDSDVKREITVDELKELLTWAFDPKRDRKNVPRLLKPRPSSEVLAALSVLCQGYLAAFAGVAAQGGIQLSADVEAALGRMHFSDIPAAFVERVKGRISEMSRRAWWRNPFDGTEWESDLRREVKDTTGGEVSADLENLIAAIRQGDAEQTLCQAGAGTTSDDSERQLAEAKLVAKAYCQVENMLHRDKETHVATQSKRIAPNASNDVTQN